MKIMKNQILAVVSTFALTGTAVLAWDFSYGFQNVYSANADTYIVGQQNVTKVTEWQTPPYTYWGPTANDVQGLLTMRFDFLAPTTEIHLNAKITSFNTTGTSGFGYGSSSLWGSRDGSSWQLLLDNPTPPNGTFGSELTYNQDVPSSLIGSSSFWLQVQMQQTGASGIAKDAQFCRTDSSTPGNIFQLDVQLVPEPSALSLVVCAGLAALCLRGRKDRQ